MAACKPGANTPDLSLKDTEDLALEIASLAAHIQAATCRLLLLIAEMDRREAYGDLYFSSCAHWLSWRTGDDISTAREKVRVARKLTECPRVQQAFAEGRVSYSKVRAITRIVTPDNEQTLLEYALEGSTSQLERAPVLGSLREPPGYGSGAPSAATGGWRRPSRSSPRASTTAAT